MADFKKMIPFIFHFAAGVPVKDLTKPLEQQWEIARRKGWSDDPDDPGGKTMIDVTLETYKTYCRKRGYPAPTADRLKNIPFDQWQEILKTMYWDKLKADDILSQGIANMCCDWIWASGTARIKNIQRIVGVIADGIVGPKTIAAINKANPVSLFAELYNARVKFYKGCSGWWKYNKGWMRRLDAINGDGTFTIYGEIIG
jgi:lysozyme family protein